jgi:hypothetical protein
MVVVKPAHAVTRRHLPSSPFNVPVIEAPVVTYAVNDRVTHDSYGLGSIVSVEEDRAVTVDFGSEPIRLTLPCARLSKL